MTTTTAQSSDPDVDFPYPFTGAILALAQDVISRIRDDATAGHEHDIAEAMWKWENEYDQFRQQEDRLFDEMGVLLEQARLRGLWCCDPR